MQSDVQCQYFMSLRSYVGKGRNLSFRACEPTTNSLFQGPELPSEGSRLGVSCDNYKREFIGNPETRLGVSERRSAKRRTAIRRAPTIALPNTRRGCICPSRWVLAVKSPQIEPWKQNGHSTSAPVTVKAFGLPSVSASKLCPVPLCYDQRIHRQSRRRR